ncbi:MAG: winged helix-turn-helix domain-containing protein [Burkholderiaceae bacterium]|nr:winged helix-turn-helix domain-containing protein [Burkholderiaceae bacterium]
MKAAQDVEFEGFRIDAQRRRLLHADGFAIALTPKAFDTLLYLLQHPGEVVEKDALMAAVWPGVVVEDNNLSQAVSTLRKALGDDPEAPRFIQTVPRRGFRLVARVAHIVPVDSAAQGVETNHADASPVAAATAQQPASAALPEPTAPSQPRRRLLAIGGAATAAVAAGVGIWWRTRHSDEPMPASQPLQTLAVLPFKPLVQEQRDEVLEIGMADSLIARLSTVPGLVVRSIGSARRYGGPTQDPLAAARELEVDWIVDGTVQRWGDLVRVTARLLRADGTARWSGSFDEKFTNVFDVQAMISDRVAGVLAPRLGARDRQGHAGGGTQNADAYQLFLAARHAAQTLRPSGLNKSIDFYKKAIALDPNYALAYAGLAETYRRLPFGADTAPSEAFEPARAAALRAIEIDPGLAEGHAGLGWVKFWYEWDWPGAEKAFRRAIELNPSAWEAHLGLGHLLSSLGRGDEGFPHIQRARELDPMSMITNTLEAGYLLGRGRRDEADQRIQRALELDPEFWVGHLTLASFHLADKQPAKALEALRTADRYSEGQSTQALALIGFLLGRTGQTEQAQAVLDRLLLSSKQRYMPPTSLAAVCAGLGDKTKALDYLERAYDVRDLRLAFMKIDGRWGTLKEEPRFQSLLKTMKLDTGPKGKAAH